MPTVEMRMRLAGWWNNLGREQGGDRFVDGFFVVKRLAHAHEDDVSHRAILGSHALAGEHDLIENLGGRETFGDSHLAGRAKAARGRAANLRRQAQRHAAGAGSHDDRFDEKPAAVRNTSFVAPSSCESVPVDS